MKVILLKTGEEKNVSRGYAVNFLLPKGLAEISTPARLAALSQRQAEQAGEQAKKQTADEEKAERFSGKVIKLSRPAGKAGKIHGSVTKKEIAAELKILKINVILAEPIKKVGEYAAELKFGRAKAPITIKVTACEK